jgi:hypothetical protein
MPHKGEGKNQCIRTDFFFFHGHWIWAATDVSLDFLVSKNPEVQEVSNGRWDYFGLGF